MIHKGDVVIHMLSWLPFRCENAKMERWMNMNPYYIKSLTNNTKTTKMRHVEKAWYRFAAEEPSMAEFVAVDSTQDIKGVAPVVSFTIQSDPIGQVGVNGCQALDMLKYVKCLFESLNEVFPCRENTMSLTRIEEAIHWQEARTKDRIRRNVEGQLKP